jgi:hypothetical protein
VGEASEDDAAGPEGEAEESPGSPEQPDPEGSAPRESRQTPDERGASDAAIADTIARRLGRRGREEKLESYRQRALLPQNPRSPKTPKPPGLRLVGNKGSGSEPRQRSEARPEGHEQRRRSRTAPRSESRSKPSPSSGWGQAVKGSPAGPCANCLAVVSEEEIQGKRAERLPDGRIHCADCTRELKAGRLCLACYQAVTVEDRKAGRVSVRGGRVFHASCLR